MLVAKEIIKFLHAEVLFCVSGYERKNIPGFPTYEVQGVENIEYNLFIYPTTLDDDAEFQCQVGPFGDIKALRGIGHLIVQGKLHCE